MEFRPCIDIHNGKVKQIVGGSLIDTNNHAEENFVSEYDSVFYANLYKKNKIKGGHVILLNGKDSEYYESTKNAAMLALSAYKDGLQVGGGITVENAKEYIDAGASHVVVTSYVFLDGKIHFERLKNLVDLVGKEKIVLDLSCRKKENDYYIVTNRWQNFTDTILSPDTIRELSMYCDEFLVHAVDVEGKANGVDGELIKMLGEDFERKITYAGGVHNFEDLEIIKKLGNNQVNVTIGSALDLFGGTMEFEKVLEYMK